MRSSQNPGSSAALTGATSSLVLRARKQSASLCFALTVDTRFNVQILLNIVDGVLPLTGHNKIHLSTAEFNYKQP